MRRILSRVPGMLRVVVLAAMLLGATGAAAPNQAGIVRLDILTVNDFHGALSETGKNPGAAKLGGYLLAEKALNSDGTLLLSAGDMFQGTPDSNMTYGRTVVQVMNVLGFDAMALGNHEFDWGLDRLKARIGEANFSCLAANVLDQTSGMPPGPVRSVVMVTKNGVKIAVIGITTPETAYATNPRLVAELTFGDPATVVNALVPVLKAQGAEVIVVLAHLGSAMDESGTVTGDAADLAWAVRGVDVIVSGHSHRRVAGMVNGVAIVQAGYNGQAVGRVGLAYSKTAGQVLAATAAVVEMEPARLTADAKIQAIVSANEETLGPVRNVVLGRTARGLYHDKMSLSPLGSWTADVMRAAVNADIAFTNGGGLRASIPAGNITLGTLYEVLPFDNTMVTLDLTGAQVLEVLNHGIDNSRIGSLQFSGLRIIIDRACPEGRKVVSVTLPDGRPLDPNATYRVVTNDFMTAGGDQYTTFQNARNITDTFIPLRDTLIEAVKKAHSVDFAGDNRLTDIAVPAAKPAA